MKTTKVIKRLRRKNCNIFVAECTGLEKGFWSEVRTRDGSVLYRSAFQYTSDDALELAKENAPIVTRICRIPGKY